MSHSTAGRRGLAGDETDHGLFHFLFHEPRGILLVGAADLSDHHYRLGFAIGFERGKAVDEIRPVDRVAPDAHARGLTESGARHLEYNLVGQRSGTTDQSNWSRRADASGNNP